MSGEGLIDGAGEFQRLRLARALAWEHMAKRFPPAPQDSCIYEGMTIRAVPEIGVDYAGEGSDLTSLWAVRWGEPMAVRIVQDPPVRKMGWRERLVRRWSVVRDRVADAWRVLIGDAYAEDWE